MKQRSNTHSEMTHFIGVIGTNNTDCDQDYDLNAVCFPSSASSF